MSSCRRMTQLFAATLTAAMLLTCGPVASFADDSNGSSASGSSVDYREEKSGSNDTKSQELTFEEKKLAEEIASQVEEMSGLTGDQTFNGMTYKELFGDNGQEAMKTIDSRRTFRSAIGL